MGAWTPDPERHRPEGMDMAVRVMGDPPGLDPPGYSPAFQDAYHQLWYEASERAERYEKALREIEKLPGTLIDVAPQIAREALGEERRDIVRL